MGKTPSRRPRLCRWSCSRALLLLAWLACLLLLLPTQHAPLAAPRSPPHAPRPASHDPRDPCARRPRPPPLPAAASRAEPPTLYFLHIPKTAGTLAYHITLQYANKTAVLPCQFLYDGNRWGPAEFQIPLERHLPHFAALSPARAAVRAFAARDRTQKLALYRAGACRTVRGHVTYSQRDVIDAPVISFTVMRHPLERFVSMYEFVRMMMSTRPGKSGWDNLLSAKSLENDFWNTSSILNKGFYDGNGTWLATNNVAFSFHFYGVLHQLSGITPVFEGVGDTSAFRITNAAEMAEKAKDNVCGTHILGLQSHMPETLGLFFDTLSPYAQWTEEQRERFKKSSANVNKSRRSRDLSFHLSERAQKELENRLHYEIQVYEFAERVVRYRQMRKLESAGLETAAEKNTIAL